MAESKTMKRIKRMARLAGINPSQKTITNSVLGESRWQMPDMNLRIGLCILLIISKVILGGHSRSGSRDTG